MIKILAALLISASLYSAAQAAPADPEAEAQARLDRSRAETLLADLDCSERKTRLLYEIVSASTGPLRNFKFRCEKGKENISTPAWLDAEVAALQGAAGAAPQAGAVTVPQVSTAAAPQSGAAAAQQVNPATADKEAVPPARLWSEPLLALGDFAELVRKTAPKDGAYGLEPRFLAPSASAILLRYDRALGQLRKSKQAGAFGGRADAAFSALVRGLSAFDDLERSFGQGSQVTFLEKSAAVLKSGEEAFAALLAGEAGRAAPVLSFSAEYRIKPRVLPGQRAVSLSLPYWQLEHLKPGDLVDLLVTYENAGAAGSRDMITATVLQGVKVLGVAKPAEAGSRGTLRLLTTALEAQYAALAQVQAREIAVTLRAEGDAEAKALDIANFKKIVK